MTDGRDTEVLKGLCEYLATRDAARWERADRMFGKLKKRERKLVREAAVLGFVKGSLMAERPVKQENFPRDTEILVMVLDGATVHNDLYPTLAKLGLDNDPA